ncbi:MAG: glycosyltransferase family 1 protein [Oscillibacter sp.]|nr:glycosyltransferase family 1 protein [Oscillibacter sp.]
MRILHLASPGLGGIEAYIFSHYQYMDREKFRFDFMTQNPRLRETEEYRAFPFQVKLLPSTAAKDPEGFSNRVREILAEGYDVLHLHTCYWTGFRIEEIAKEMGVSRVVVHSHSTFIDEPDGVKRAELLRRHEEVKRAFSPDLATDYWACSSLAADWLFGPQIPRDRVRMVKNAIDVGKYRFHPEKRTAIRQELGLEGNFVLGTVGRMSYQKNHSFLIDLFAEFHQIYPRSKLLIVGDGELREALTEQVLHRNLEKAVLLPGWRTDVETYLQAMDLFLLPSRFEGLGIVAVEAAASGLPCVVSSQVPDDVAFTKNIWHRPLDIPAWLSAVEELASREYDRNSGFEAVRAAGYDIRQQAKVLEGLYEGEGT